MTYAECRDAALKLLNQYSIGGELIASSYNNQYDYLKRMPELIYNAMLIIATTALPIEAVFEPTETAELSGGWLALDFPPDFIRLPSRGLIRLSGGRLSFNKDYRMLTRSRMAIRREALSDTVLVYCKAPAKITLSSPDNTLLELPDYAAAAVPYYVAAHLVIGEDSFVYATLYNEFESRLERLKPPVESETELIEDAYGLTGVY